MGNPESEPKLSCKHATIVMAMALFGTIMVTCSAMGPWLESKHGITESWANPFEVCVPHSNYTRDCTTHQWREYGIKYDDDRRLVYGVLITTIVFYFAVTVGFMFSCDPCPSACLFRTYIVIEITMTIMMHIALLFWLNCKDNYREILANVLHLPGDSLEIAYNRKYFAYIWLGLIMGYILFIHWMSDSCPPRKKKKRKQYYQTYEDYQRVDRIGSLNDYRDFSYEQEREKCDTIDIQQTRFGRYVSQPRDIIYH